MYLATHDKPFLPEGFLEKFKAVKELGFDAFEIDGKVLAENHAEIEKASQKASLPVKMVCGGYGGWIGDFNEEKRRQGLKDIEEILKICGSMGISGIVVPAAWGMFSLRLPPMVPPRSAEDDKKVLLDSLSRLDKTAGETGTNVYLEPLNRYENHMILTLDDAGALIDAGSFGHVKITADFYHMNIEEAHIEESIKKHADKIGHVHVASSQRIQPGRGHIDFVPGFQALREIGYDGGVSIECRVDGGMKEYKESVEFLRDKLQKAGY